MCLWESDRRPAHSGQSHHFHSVLLCRERVNVSEGNWAINIPFLWAHSVSVTETASHTEQYMTVEFICSCQFYICVLVSVCVLELICTCVSVTHAYPMKQWLKSTCIRRSSPSVPLIPPYFQCVFCSNSWTFTILLDYFESSSQAKVVALGGSVKNFISDHKCICLVLALVGFSQTAGLFAWL